LEKLLGEQMVHSILMHSELEQIQENCNEARSPIQFEKILKSC